MMNSNTESNLGAGNSNQVTVALPGSSPVGNQAGLGRQPNTGIQSRRRFTRDDNIRVLECYYLSKPTKRGYRRRMLQIWDNRGYEGISEQRLADQVNTILRKGWFSQLELDNIKKTIDTPETEIFRADAVEVTTNIETEPNSSSSINVPVTTDNETLLKLKQAVDNLNEKRSGLPSLRAVKRKTVLQELKKFNSALEEFEVENITTMSKVYYAVAQLVTHKLIKKTEQNDK